MFLTLWPREEEVHSLQRLQSAPGRPRQGRSYTWPASVPEYVLNVVFSPVKGYLAAVADGYRSLAASSRLGDLMRLALAFDEASSGEVSRSSRHTLCWRPPLSTYGTS
ncbi:MAG: hypothetical protein ACP5H1_06360 [Acidilobus sp.]